MRITEEAQFNGAALFAVAGIKTAPDFMQELIEQLRRKLTEERRLPVDFAGLLFPYGDWNVRSTWQIRRIRRDLMLPMAAYERSYGAIEILKSVSDALNGNPVDRLILIGHSAGGVASVQAAAAFMRGGALARVVQVIQVGSPKIRVPALLRERVCYLYAGRRDGKNRDRICSIGSWGGWERGRGSLPRWNRRMHAPGHIEAVPIIGGHRDYFRDREPFRNREGFSNLELMLDRMLAVL